jgi:predicted aspartyl protease
VTQSASRKARAQREKLQRKLEREPIVLEFRYPQPQTLSFFGPVIVTNLTITDVHRKAMEAAGQRPPAPVQCRFLLDTGADGTVVKHEIAERAGLKLISENTPLHGVGIDTTGRTYMGRVLFVVQSRISTVARHTVAVETRVMGAKLESDQIDGLIGRDVLQHFEFTYDGHEGFVRLRYYRP